MRFGTVFALAASVAVAAAEDKYLGFNSGATTDAGKIKKQADFEQEFSTAQKLKGAPGTFSSVRLYTNIQGDTTDSPIEAIPAAIKTKTKILLGMWTSGTDNIDNELSALSKAIEQYGSDFTDLVVGISVGSEDLYRVSIDGIKNKSGVGAEVNTIVEFIKNTRDKLKGTALAKTPVGHVDTWTAWANSSNKAVIDASDFVGVNTFPYYENGNNIQMTNEIDNAADIFQASFDATKEAVGDKPMWITETGWPTTGPKWNQAVPSVDNAKKYWDTVGCTLFGQVNTFWYILRDSNPDNKMKFGIDPELDGTPQFNLTCPEKTATPTPSKTPSASATGNGSASASPTASGTGTGTSNQSTQNDSSQSSPSPAQQTGSGADVARLSPIAFGLSMLLAVAGWMA
ncbi:glycoside hydrolase family 17 protein [Lentithecium fluviatile CBS 122367]|uniref:Glycoside hydrolase family 17 protein n=1 Tax=Lentithecium fluviatile CBS 122367 TaxID=1168545 RepID=A0A6G1JJ76_9PLEO|nr:glycoside hydrolase family 17 protein [Lentithecium fluviatile CBS 122367]